MKNREKKLFPLFTDLTEKKAVVFGAGTIATRRVKTLLSFVGEIRVIAPKASNEILDLWEKGELVYQKKIYEREDLYDADLVLAATDDDKVNEDIYSACKCLGILVNIASDQKKCDFHFPAVIEQDGVVIGMNAGGKDHKKVKEVRQSIETYLTGSREETE
nr:bifunctional precorrin-2 dehydrogenase/sirohydrochlorin ferrochelatase [uncultured Blautia sp.]